MKKILLTGFSGFVGSHFYESFEKKDNVNLLGRNNSNNYKNFFLSNIGDFSDYSKALEDVQTVIHCAARVHVMNESSSEPLEEFRKVNTRGTVSLARQAAKSGVKRFIFISTIKVNGETTSGKAPFRFSDKPRPQDPYGISKAEAEQELLVLGKSTGMEIVIIRPPLVYGAGVKANFYSLMRLVSKGIPLPFRAISNNRRSLVSVYNLVDLIKVCINHPNAANKIFLVSDDNDLSTANMISLMAKVQGKRSLCFPVPVFCFSLLGSILKKEEIIDRLVGSLQVDISDTKNTLNWTPPYSVEHGFKLSSK